MTYTRNEYPRLYNSWRAMRARCNNPNQKDYKYYGGKGITYIEEWKYFNVFAEWAINTGYKEGYTIDRINSNDNYSTTNCRWISHSDNVIRANKERYYNRYRDAYDYWRSIDGDITGTELATIFGVSFSAGCKWIRKFKKEYNGNETNN